MRVFTTIIAFIIVSSFFKMWGQEQIIAYPRIYKAPDGKLYVNKNLPMYLFIGNSPGTKGELSRLESKDSPQYTNPFYFDTEGHNTIRTPSKVDTITKKTVYPISDIIFDVYADGLPPKSKATFENAFKFMKDGKLFYGKGLMVSITANDQTSGVDKTYYSIDNQPYLQYLKPIEFSQAKSYTLKYYSCDNVGNIESVATHNFTVDITPPVATWTLEGDVFENAASGTSNIVLMAQDSESGIKHIKYQVDDRPVTIYKNGISLSTIPSGAYKLRYWAEDNVGNIFEGADGGTNVYAFVVDRIPPKTSSQIIGDKFVGKNVFVSERSLCQLIAIDEQLKVRTIIYGLGTPVLTEIYDQPFSFVKKPGVQTIYFQAWDMVANQSVIDKVTVFMDIDEPVTRIDYSGPQFFSRDTLFINKETVIKLISRDGESGVANIEYSINNQPFQSGSQFSISNDGLQKIAFRATDNVNNREQDKQSELYVDNLPPDIYVNFSIKSFREEIIDNEKISVYPPYVKMYIGATDRNCGTQDIFYSIDGGQKTKFTGSVSPANSEVFSTEKLYEVKIDANDKLGNSTSKTIKFRIAKK